MFPAHRYSSRGTQTKSADQSDKPESSNTAPLDQRHQSQASMWPNNHDISHTKTPLSHPISARSRLQAPTVKLEESESLRSISSTIKPGGLENITSILPSRHHRYGPAAPSLPRPSKHPDEHLMNALALAHLDPIARRLDGITMPEIPDAQPDHPFKRSLYPKLPTIVQRLIPYLHKTKVQRTAIATPNDPIVHPSRIQTGLAIAPEPSTPPPGPLLKDTVEEPPNEIRELPRPARHYLIADTQSMDIKVDGHVLYGDRPAFSRAISEEAEEIDRSDPEETLSIMSGLVVNDEEGRKIWIGEDINF